MIRFSTLTLLASVVSVFLGFAPAAYGHATYNLSGYAAGIGGSTNGADGNPADATAAWTNGPTEYTGALPVNWYCGLHNPTQVRSIQTGQGANPPSGSQLAQVTSYNAANDPDLAIDTVLAVGGLSWTDPSNDNQGWGHGLDFGLIHVSPLDELEADGPLTLTVTLQDDPTDGVAVQLAYALYAGWDTSSTSVRHQTFTTNPTPVDNPLGSSGLTLVDYAVASTPGATLSRSYDIDPAFDGKYTIFVAAQGGVGGQYQLNAAVFPITAELNEQLTECQDSLATANATVESMTADADGDEVPDQRDTCSETPAGQFVDVTGCSQAQFCAKLPANTKPERSACKKADWNNDEPTMKSKQADCAFAKASKTCEAKL